VPIHLDNENPPNGLTADFWEHAKKRKEGNPEYGEDHQKRFDQMISSLNRVNRLFDKLYGTGKKLNIEVNSDLLNKQIIIIERLSDQIKYFSYFCLEGHQKGQKAPLRSDDWDVVRSAEKKLENIFDEQQKIYHQFYDHALGVPLETKETAAAKERIFEAIKSIETNIKEWKKDKLKAASEDLEKYTKAISHSPTYTNGLNH